MQLSSSVKAGLDTVRLFTPLGGYPLKRQYWLSEKSQFWLADGVQANVCRKGIPGISVNGSLPRLIRGDNAQPANQLDALQGAIALVRSADHLFENPPPLENWHFTRMDVAFDFAIPFDSHSLEQIGWYALPKGKQKVRKIGGEQFSLYFQADRYKPNASVATLAYIRDVEGREPYLRLETRFRSRAIKGLTPDRGLLKLVSVGQSHINSAWERHLDRWLPFLWAESTEDRSPSVIGYRRERLEEFAAALEEMPIWKLRALWPFDDAKKFRDDIRQGFLSGIIQLPPLTNCAQAFVRVLQNELPPVWSPY
ncbi:MAG: hypothetical protein ACK5ZK_09485 [Armatimonadota bacterium]|nr:hypothetical protein [Fimbriimonadaceae bacterium]